VYSFSIIYILLSLDAAPCRNRGSISAYVLTVSGSVPAFQRAILRLTAVSQIICAEFDQIINPIPVIAEITDIPSLLLRILAFDLVAGRVIERAGAGSAQTHHHSFFRCSFHVLSCLSFPVVF
jgi:hypothetical protein